MFIGVKEGTGERYVKEERFNNEERFFAYRRLEEIEQLLKECKFSIQKGFIRSPDHNSWVNIFAIAE